MNWKFEKEPDKCSKAKKIIIPLVFVIILIVMISWSSQGFAADYIPPNSTIRNGAPGHQYLAILSSSVSTRSRSRVL